MINEADLGRRAVPLGLGVLLVLQVASAVFFIVDIFSALLGWRPLAWRLYELVQVGAALSLILGVVATALVLRQSRMRLRRAEDAVRAARGAMTELMDERFDDWGLTPSERDVAIFSLKGLSIAEIAAIRATSDGTVKAQCAAIYRKAGVSGRSQLMSLFIDDLLGPGLQAAA
ncbi:helix-turn-helix transcriptional regulator [Pseudaestuariivita atlantica]|uniref:LuxR family transcriptional regulator n=1 Tax=Pseudaestuariivita atlantica TaxID=1317121 RepID=A0A0L1JTX6_9RHOB|nr:LuxR C-terminal-related transcriptional regulator [Pseudaestuariivita atlantica]KNG95211.1 LuxR family transcriptional regulator [Pseudaestuariivita atlantica]